jgi:hypothetical protein
MAFYCVSQQGEFKNTTKLLKGSPCRENLLPKKLRGKKILSFSPCNCFNRVLAVFMHDELKKHYANMAVF